jgi:hypothetical protein
VGALAVNDYPGVSAVSWRLFSVLVGLTAVGLFSGCATGPRTAGVESEVEPESIQGPSTLIAGARIADVRSLAMGAARSKGWIIVSASDQKLVLRRPVNTDAPQAVALGLDSGGAPADVEVRTYFLQRSDGVNVVANAQLVTHVQGNGPAEQRTDYTETYRESLMRSLGSLRTAWAAHHERVARALPPASQQGAAAAETAAELNEQQGRAPPGAPLQSPLPQGAATAWGASEPESAAVAGQGRAYPLAEPTPMPERAPVSAPAAPPAPVPVPVAATPKTQNATPVSASTPARAVPTSLVAKPTTTATRSAPAPVAPVAKPTAASVAPTAKVAAKPAAKPAPAPSTSSNNIATLPPQGGSQIAKAESFAQSHGCKVQSGRTIVHKRDADADFLRVYCVGDPPFLVKCGGGRCKLIE